MGLCLSVTGRKKKVKAVGWKGCRTGGHPVAKAIGWSKQKKGAVANKSPENYVPAEAASGYLSMASDANFSKVSRMEQSYDDDGNLGNNMSEQADTPYHRSPISLARQSFRRSKISPTRGYVVRKIPNFSQIQNLASSMGKSQTEFRPAVGVRPLIEGKSKNSALSSRRPSSRYAGRKSRGHEASSPGPTLRNLIGSMMGDSGSNVDNHVVWVDADNRVAWMGLDAPKNGPEGGDRFQHAGRQFDRIVSTGSSTVTHAPPETDRRIAMVAAAVIKVDGQPGMDHGDKDKLPSFVGSSGGDFSISTSSDISIQEVAKSYKESAAIARARDRHVFNRNLSDNDRSVSFSSRHSDKISSIHSSSPSSHASVRKFRTESRDLSGTSRRGLSQVSPRDVSQEKNEPLLVNRSTTISPAPSWHGSWRKTADQEQRMSQGSTEALMRASMNEPRSNSLQYTFKGEKEFANSVQMEFEVESNYPFGIGLRGTRIPSNNRNGLPWKSRAVLGEFGDYGLKTLQEPCKILDPITAGRADLHFAEYHTFLDKLPVDNTDSEITVLEDRPSISDGEMMAVLQGRPSTQSTASDTYFNSVEVSSRLSSDSVCGSFYNKELSGNATFERSSGVLSSSRNFAMYTCMCVSCFFLWWAHSISTPMLNGCAISKS